MPLMLTAEQAIAAVGAAAVAAAGIGAGLRWFYCAVCGRETGHSDYDMIHGGRVERFRCEECQVVAEKRVK